MPDLFGLGELASYLQVPEVDNATADLLLDLVTAEIRAYVGGSTYDTLTDADLAAFKGIALEAARRSYLNPDGVRTASSSIDDYQESKTYASETFGGIDLTDTERNRIDRILGRSGGAFTIRPAGVPDCPSWPSHRHHHAAY